MNTSPSAHNLWTNEELLTGEAVALVLPTASVFTRITGALLDLVVLCVAGYAVQLFLTWILAPNASQAVIQIAFIVSGVFLLVILPASIETLSGGRSIGKLAAGLRVVRDDAGPISMHHAFIRALVWVIEVFTLLGIPAICCMVFQRHGKRLGDLLAGTQVVRTRIPVRLVAPQQPSPAMAEWMAVADVGSLPSSLAISARDLLSRGPKLAPQARQVLVDDLVGRVSAYTSPAPPLGVTGEDFLAGVLALRRQREAAKLGRARELRQRLHGAVNRRP